MGELTGRIARIDATAREIGMRVSGLHEESAGQINAALVYLAAVRSCKAGVEPARMLQDHLRWMADLIEEWLNR